MVSIFNEKGIGKIKICKLKNIAYRGYSSSIYEEYFANINSFSDLVYCDNNLIFSFYLCFLFFILKFKISTGFVDKIKMRDYL